MKLITKDTTIEEFMDSNHWLVIRPLTGKVFCIKLREYDRQTATWYGWAIQNIENGQSFHIRLIGSHTIVVEDKTALLHRLQTKQFDIR